VKSGNSVKIYHGSEQAALEKILEVLQSLAPTLEVITAEINAKIDNPKGRHRHIDVRIEVLNYGVSWILNMDVTGSAYSGRLMDLIIELKKLKEDRVYPILAVPWASERLIESCIEADIGYLDLEGNFRLVFGGLHAISRGAPAPKSEVKSLRSLFRPKSARVLRTLLKQPNRPWRTQNLANQAGVSLGYAHKVKTALAERGWLTKEPSGFHLTHPQDLLEQWRGEWGDTRANQRMEDPHKQKYYTLKHGAALQKALQPNDGQHWVYASYSAADWLAPLARQAVLHLVADNLGLRHLQTVLQLEPVKTGFNVIIYLDPEGDILQDRFEAAPGIWTTSPVQTYLELYNSHDRGREAAEYLRKTRIEPMWTEPITELTTEPIRSEYDKRTTNRS
jgi:hypothetical protein